jgi:putative transposase
LFGITRQAYYQYNWEAESLQTADLLVVKQVLQLREIHPRMGTRKLYELLEPFMLEHGIKMGRDALFDLLAANKLLIRKRRRNIQTTYSRHWLKKYPNLIRTFVPKSINQLWVSDITYWKIDTQKHLYISLITDAYSRKIIGYQVAETMESIESCRALQMALSAINKKQGASLIHHSDRGIQYCSNRYVKLLQDYNIRISMTENGDPLENAIAERVNGILKEEYLNHYCINNITEAYICLKQAIEAYNNQRPHMSISNLTPNKVHSNRSINPKRLWKNYFKKVNNLEPVID